MLRKAAAYIKENGAPIVVKADGLAAGKGVVVATTVKEALDAAEQMLNQHRFGDSSKNRRRRVFGRRRILPFGVCP